MKCVSGDSLSFDSLFWPVMLVHVVTVAISYNKLLIASLCWLQLDLQPTGRLELQIKFYSESSNPQGASVSERAEMTSEEKRNTGGIARRQGAVKHAKIHDIKDHQFLATFFRQPVFCSFCSEFMWWVTNYMYIYVKIVFDMDTFWAFPNQWSMDPLNMIRIRKWVQ